MSHTIYIIDIQAHFHKQALVLEEVVVRKRPNTILVLSPVNYVVCSAVKGLSYLK